MERKMTIARGLARLKTIKAQLDSINSQFRVYSAFNNKKKHPLGSNNENVEKTHAQAQETINSLYQQYNDLMKEYMNIKSAIDKTNMVTEIEIAGKTMTVYEALLYKRDIQGFNNDLVSAFNQAVYSAQRDIDAYNKQFVNASEEVKRVTLADISYFIDKTKIEETTKFRVEFLNELDGMLNEVNATTELIGLQ